MCSGCKIMGYCSKECQRADWGTHQLLCKGAQTGTIAISRDPVIKLAERLLGEAQIMGWVDAIIITCLDLVNNPDNASKYFALLLARADTVSKNTETGRVEKLFQITKVSRLRIEDAPRGLKDLGNRMEATLRDLPKHPSTVNVRAVRALWQSEPNLAGMVCFSRHVNQPALDIMAVQTMPGPFVPPLPVTSECLIELFNGQPNRDEDTRRKFTIVLEGEQ